MAKIFICYRREDSGYPAHQIYEKLTNHFGAESVLFDVDTIPLGKDFREYLKNQVSECDILLAIIGNQWLELLKQRIDDPKDFVQIEIQAALKRDIPVVPILVHNALMPDESDLPPELIGLSYKNATEVRAGADLTDHIKRLIKGLDNLLDKRKAGEGNSEKTEAKIKPGQLEPVEDKSPESKTDAKELKHSGVGIASFIISLVAVVLLFVVFAFAANQGITLILLLDIIALGLGIGGLKQKNRNKTFSKIGITIVSFKYLFGIIMAVIGNMLE